MKFTPLALVGLLGLAQAAPDLGDDLKTLAEGLGDDLGEDLGKVGDQLKTLAGDKLESLEAIPTQIIASLSDELMAKLSSELFTATGEESARITSAIAEASQILHDAGATATDAADDDDDEDDDSGAAYAPTAAVAFAGLVGGVAVFFNL
ncbi:hypothetical protein ACO1O0_008125 [Amphichorda felina]